MGTPWYIWDISQWNINWVVLLMSNSNRDHCFIASHYNWDKHGTMSSKFLFNYILKIDISHVSTDDNATYCLFECLKTRHKIGVNPLIIAVEFHVRDVAEIAIKFGCGKQLFNDHYNVTNVEFIGIEHPVGRIFWFGTIVTEVYCLSRGSSSINGVNCLVEFFRISPRHMSKRSLTENWSLP